MKTLLFVFALIGVLSVASPASAMRFGLGLGSNIGTGQQASVNSIVARAEVMPKAVLNLGLGFRTESGDFNDGSSVGLSVGGQFRIFTNEANNLHFHILGGLGFARTSVEVDVPETPPKTGTFKDDAIGNEINLYGGFGAEYFFPGTDQFSMQIDVGPRIDLLSHTPAGSGTDQDGTVLSLAENLSSGILFTYYFAMPAKK